MTFIGGKNEIHVGWYSKNLIEGNWMQLDGDNMRIKESGWYEEGQRKRAMKYDAKR